MRSIDKITDMVDNGIGLTKPMLIVGYLAVIVQKGTEQFGH